MPVTLYSRIGLDLSKAIEICWLVFSFLNVLSVMGAPARSSSEKLCKRALFIIHLGFVSIIIHELRASLSTVHETSLAKYLVLTYAF